MEASVPLVTQAPPIQPLQIRPGVITQVKGVARMQVMVIETEHRLRLRDSLSFLVSVDLVNTLCKVMKALRGSLLSGIFFFFGFSVL